MLRILPFFQARSQAELLFDLSLYRDFHLTFQDQSVDPRSSGDAIYTLKLDGQEEANGYLHFWPSEV